MDLALAPEIVKRSSPRACHHCGEACDDSVVSTSVGQFCCQGCASVFATLAAHCLNGFYSGDAPAGVCQRAIGDRDPGRFAILDDPAIAARLLDVDTGRIARATL